MSRPGRRFATFAAIALCGLLSACGSETGQPRDRETGNPAALHVNGPRNVRFVGIDKALTEALESEGVGYNALPGAELHFVLSQPLLPEGVYAEWYAALEHSDGSSREIYVEARLEIVSSGVMSFDCDDPEKAPTFRDFGTARQRATKGTAHTIDRQRIERFRHENRDDAKRGQSPFTDGAGPPPEILEALQARFCPSH